MLRRRGSRSRGRGRRGGRRGGHMAASLRPTGLHAIQVAEEGAPLRSIFGGPRRVEDLAASGREARGG
eukprot:scaffold96902_cov60-Phaeocystis_antarctica.AAC.2